MQILNEGEYNYVQQCILKGRSNTCESHVITYRKHRVCSPLTRLNCRLKSRRDHRNRRQGLLSPQQLAGKCRTLRQEHFNFVYTVHVLTVKTIRGRSLFHL